MADEQTTATDTWPAPRPADFARSLVRQKAVLEEHLQNAKELKWSIEKAEGVYGQYLDDLWEEFSCYLRHVGMSAEDAGVLVKALRFGDDKDLCAELRAINP